MKRFNTLGLKVTFSSFLFLLSYCIVSSNALGFTNDEFADYVADYQTQFKNYGLDCEMTNLIPDKTGTLVDGDIVKYHVVVEKPSGGGRLLIEEDNTYVVSQGLVAPKDLTRRIGPSYRKSMQNDKTVSLFYTSKHYNITRDNLYEGLKEVNAFLMPTFMYFTDRSGFMVNAHEFLNKDNSKIYTDKDGNYLLEVINYNKANPIAFPGYRFYLDAQHDYLPHKVDVFVWPDSSPSKTYQFSDLEHATPKIQINVDSFIRDNNIWFPGTFRIYQYDNKTIERGAKYKISSFHANAEIDPNIFNLEMPANFVMIDGIKGIKMRPQISEKD